MVTMLQKTKVGTGCKDTRHTCHLQQHFYDISNLKLL
jgi:hypothetical protein